MNKEPIVTSPLRIPKSLDDEIKAYMEKHGASKNKLVIKAIQEFLRPGKDP